MTQRALQLLQTFPDDLLAAAARGELDLNRLARHELGQRGLNWQGQWIGFAKAKALATCSPVRDAKGRVIPVSIPE